MASQSGNDHQPIHPQVPQSNPTPSAPPMHPSDDTSDLVSPETQHSSSSSSSDSDTPTSSRPPPAIEETLISIPGAILHLIDKHQSIELACGDLSIIRLRQGENSLAVLARVANEVQWPLARDAAAVKLDESHYFFSLPLPSSSDSSDLLNYGLTFASKGQQSRLEELDRILESYTGFSLQKVEEKLGSEVLDVSVEKGVGPEELMGEWAKKLMMEERSAAYWTTLAPNVEDYSGLAAKAIALGSGQLVRGILWCGEVTVDRMNKGNGMLKKRMAPGGKPAEISPEAMKRMERVKKVTKMSEKVATGILSGVVKVSGYFTSSVANSNAGKKFFGLLPGEIVLASLDGFGKICDAVEVAGKNVLSTSSVVTTGLVSHRFGDQAADFANHGLQSAGHAIGIAWTVFKVRKGFDPKNSLTTSLAKSAEKAAGEIKGKKGK